LYLLPFILRKYFLTQNNLHMNVVILKGRQENVFLKNARQFFSRSRMDMRVCAFESLMSQLSQKFLFVFISILKILLHYLKVGGNPFLGDIKWHFFEIFELKIIKKNFLLKIFIRLFSVVFTSSPVTLSKRFGVISSNVHPNLRSEPVAFLFLPYFQWINRYLC